MTSERTRRLISNLCMGQIRQYHNDLREYFAGDEGRFTRMVTDGGKQLPSASPQGWAQHIANLSIECIPYHATELRLIYADLAAWGLKADSTIFDNEVCNGETR